MRVKTFNNTFVRSGQKVNPRTHTKKLIDYVHNFYQKEIDTKKQQKTKDAWSQKRKEVMSVFTKYKAKDFENVFTLMNLLADAKQLIIDKMNEASEIGTFLRTRQGFSVTAQEGFVAIDHLSGNAVKIVDRMEFSRANFSKDVIKGWEK
jgi:hypothetical protein